MAGLRHARLAAAEAIAHAAVESGVRLTATHQRPAEPSIEGQRYWARSGLSDASTGGLLLMVLSR